MLKRRLIFTLLADQGRFVLSRNFKLQIVGDYDWLCEHYEFEALAFSVDELVILDVSRKSRDHGSFAGLVEKIASRCFVPITAGGGIRCLKDAQRLLRSGADKITVNCWLAQDYLVVSCFTLWAFWASDKHKTYLANAVCVMIAWAPGLNG